MIYTIIWDSWRWCAGVFRETLENFCLGDSVWGFLGEIEIVERLESKWMNFDSLLHIRDHVLQKRRWISDSGILWWGTVSSIYFWFSYFLDIVAFCYLHFLVSDTRLFNHWFELVWSRHYDIKIVLFNHLNTLLLLILIIY